MAVLGPKDGGLCEAVHHTGYGDLGVKRELATCKVNPHVQVSHIRPRLIGRRHRRRGVVVPAWGAGRSAKKEKKKQGLFICSVFLLMTHSSLYYLVLQDAHVRNLELAND